MQGPNPTNFPGTLLHKPRSACNLTRQTHWIPKYYKHWTLQLNYMPGALHKIPQVASKDINLFQFRYFLYLLQKRDLSEPSL